MTSRFRQRVRIVLFRRRVREFFQNQSLGGILLLICSMVALASANIPALSCINEFWNNTAGVIFNNFSLVLPLSGWINDGLMAVFFFTVGLEIKREVLVGQLSTIKHATLPIIAAIGGMLFPAIIYSIFNLNGEGSNGWGIPIATDIAFVLGVLYLFGKRIPIGLKVFLIALAIVDDLGAILVIAVFYPNHDLQFTYGLYALIIILALWLLNRGKVHDPVPYGICGILLWYFIYKMGIHATIAGVILAMMIPSKSIINEMRFYRKMNRLIGRFREAGLINEDILTNPTQQEIIHEINLKVDRMSPMLHRFEHRLHPWVTFLILPLFALVNAGVVISSDMFTPPISSVSLGIFLGLIVGKPVGIFIFSWLAVKLKISALPAGSKWKHVFSLGILAGIGFTMSIFIDTLAFSDPQLINTGKASILFTSLIAAITGSLAIYFTTKKDTCDIKT